MSFDPTPFAAAPGFTLFHTRAWIDALLHAFPRWRDASAVIALPDGRRVWLPLLQTDRVGPWRWLEAMPFGFLGGPVAETGTIRPADLGFVLDCLWHGAGWLAINLDPADPLAVPGAISAGAVAMTTHLLDLTDGFATAERGFTRTARYDMRRAEREGVVARRGSGAADFDAYFALLRLSAQRWGLTEPPYPQALYRALARLPEDCVSLWLAEYDGQAVGGLINLYYAPGRVLHWSGALDSDYARLNPAKLLQREAIREACDRGAVLYNMGPSVGFDGRPLDGVRQAKEALGARPHAYAIPILMQPWAMRFRAVKTLARRRLNRLIPA